MVKKTVTVRTGESKGVRAELTDHEIRLIREMVELYGVRGTAKRFDRIARR